MSVCLNPAWMAQRALKGTTRTRARVSLDTGAATVRQVIVLR